MASDERLALIALLLDEDDEDDFDQRRNAADIMFFVVASLLQGDERVRIRGYIEEVVPHYTDDVFRRMFRLNPSTYTALLRQVCDYPEFKPAGPGGRDPVPIEKQILLTLWYVGGTEPITKIADRFGVSESTVVMCRDRVLSVLVKISHRIIAWPTAQEMIEEVGEFQKRNGFPGIVGALDGTHIRIKAPSKHPQSYVNRKSFHSVQLQCVCRQNMLFSHVFTGYPGSCHDSRILKNSDLWDTGLNKCNMVHHIIADGAYPLRRWLLTPFRDNGHLSPCQKKYNHYHSANRVVIERAFALLKCRFRRLHFIDSPKVSTIVDIIMACCVLHNVCILENDEIEEYLVQEENDDNVPVNNVNIFHDHTAEGLLKRDRIARNLV